MGDMIQVSQGCLEATEKMLGDARGRGAVRRSRWIRGTTCCMLSASGELGAG